MISMLRGAKRNILKLTAKKKPHDNKLNWHPNIELWSISKDAMMSRSNSSKTIPFVVSVHQIYFVGSSSTTRKIAGDEVITEHK
jgi:hypothetical protein